MTDKLFVVVRADLPVGAQLAQVGHVAALAGACWGSDASRLPIAVLHAPDESEVQRLFVRACDRDLRVVHFREPDLGGAWTAVAFFGVRAAGVARDLPLAFGS